MNREMLQVLLLRLRHDTPLCHASKSDTTRAYSDHDVHGSAVYPHDCLIPISPEHLLVRQAYASRTTTQAMKSVLQA